jgi:hypothetical protein
MTVSEESPASIFRVKVTSTCYLFHICLLNFLLQGEVVYVLKRLTLSAEEICSFVIGDACGDVYNPYHEWEVIFPPVPKPVVTPLVAPTVRTCGVLQ